ncbi:hypothetical protein AALC25_02430 [Lachnospiraceae bacterium 29-84]
MEEGDIFEYNRADTSTGFRTSEITSIYGRYFMTACFADNFEGVELILRIILGREDIKIKSVRTQEPLKNLQGRSAILDVHAIDSTDNEAALDNARETARRMMKDGELSLEKIAHYVPALSMEELKEIEAEVMQLA